MMKNRLLKRSAGVSIIDVIVGLALSVIVAVVVYNFYELSTMTWSYSISQGSMQRTAMLGMEKMIHGVDAAHKGIAEASDMFLPVQDNSGDAIQFEDPAASGVSRSFYLAPSVVGARNRIVYMDENDNLSDVIESGVESLTFTRPNGRDNLVLIEFSLVGTVLEKDITVNMSTAVELRNYDG